MAAIVRSTPYILDLPNLSGLYPRSWPIDINIVALHLFNVLTIEFLHTESVLCSRDNHCRIGFSITELQSPSPIDPSTSTFYTLYFAAFAKMHP